MVSTNQRNFRLMQKPNFDGEVMVSGSQTYVGSNGQWLLSNQIVPRGFNKDTVSNLRVWFDFSDSSTMTLSTGNRIQSIRNKTGEAGFDIAQGTEAYQPIYTGNRINGLATAVFDGTNDWLEFDTANISQPITVFLVVKCDDTSALNIPFSTGGATPRIDLNYASGAYVANSVAMYATSNGASIGNYITSKPNLIMGFYSGTSSYGSVNGSAASCSPGTGALAAISIGRNWASTYYLTGDACEVLIFDRELTEDEKVKVKGYLNSKWNIY